MQSNPIYSLVGCYLLADSIAGDGLGSDRVYPTAGPYYRASLSDVIDAFPQPARTGAHGLRGVPGGQVHPSRPLGV